MWPKLPLNILVTNAIPPRDLTFPLPVSFISDSSQPSHTPKQRNPLAFLHCFCGGYLHRYPHWSGPQTSAIWNLRHDWLAGRQVEPPPHRPLLSLHWKTTYLAIAQLILSSLPFMSLDYKCYIISYFVNSKDFGTGVFPTLQVINTST